MFRKTQGEPLKPDSPCPSGLSAWPCHGWDLPFWLPATVHILLKPGFENFKHYFANVWDECNCVVVWTLFDTVLLWDWNENSPFQFCGYCWVFQICWHIECSIFTASSFRIWNSLAGIPSLPLALFVVMLPKLTWLHTLGCLALGEWPMPS